ncbi:Esterase FE4 [Orchesella cincta]|uniref:Esterase FE4 n=1 Tax=Orchesella cincta TaxID=48709 RepID=A0A1D2M311_ORCCI|nr:Esterase FE4 [Orchesella cincta]
MIILFAEVVACIFSAIMHVGILFILVVAVYGGSSSSSNARNKVQQLNGTPFVQLQHGMYFGKTLRSRKGQPYHAFLGIRYAATPKRFEQSTPMSALDISSVPLLAQSHGSSCPQISQDGRNYIGKEDCLFGNFHVPTSEPPDDDGFPVIVFIHPGSFKSGSGAAFDVSYVMDESVMWATFNYRLGVLGFLSLEDEVLPGNFGLADQITFLEWLKENIEGFGGNKRRITVCGVGAGASSVQYLLLSQSSKGLFQSAVVHGGSMFSSFQPNPTSFTKAVSDELGCPHQPSHLLLECFRMKRLKDFMRIQQIISEKYFNFSSPFLPSSAQKCKRFKLCSNSFLTKPPTVLLAERQYKRVPLLVGMNSNDLHNSPTNDFHNKSETEKDNFANWLLRVLEKIPNIRYSELSYHFPEIQQLYFNQSERDNGDLLISSSSLNNFLYEAVVVHGLWKFAMTYAYDKPVYPYIITFQGTTKSMFHGELTVSSIASYLLTYSWADWNYKLKLYSIQGECALLVLSVLNLFLHYCRNSLKFSYCVDESENRAFPDGIEFLTPSLPNLHEFESGSDEELFSQHLVHLWATFATHQKPVDVWDDKQTWLPMSVAQLNGKSQLLGMVSINTFRKSQHRLCNE